MSNETATDMAPPASYAAPPSYMKDSYSKVLYMGSHIITKADSLSAQVLPEKFNNLARHLATAAQPRALQVHEMIELACQKADTHVVNNYLTHYKCTGIRFTILKIFTDICHFLAGLLTAVLWGKVESLRSLEDTGRSASVESMEDHLRQAKVQAEEQEARDLQTSAGQPAKMIDSIFYFPLSACSITSCGMTFMSEVSGSKPVDLSARPAEYQLGWRCGIVVKETSSMAYRWFAIQTRQLMGGKTIIELRSWAEKRGYYCRHRASAD